MKLKLERLHATIIENGTVKYEMELVTSEKVKKDFVTKELAQTENGEFYYSQNSQNIYEIGLNANNGWWSSNPDAIKKYLGIELFMVSIREEESHTPCVYYLTLEDAKKLLPVGFKIENGYVVDKNPETPKERQKSIQKELKENEELWQKRQISFSQYISTKHKYSWDTHSIDFE